MRLEQLVPASRRPLGVCCAIAAICLYQVMPQTSSARGGSGAPPRVKGNNPFFEEVEGRLKAVRSRSSKGVPTVELLYLSYAIISIFDAMPGMGMVKSDMLGNCDKIWRHLGGEGNAPTLEDMVAAELEALAGDSERARKRDGSVCNSLLWLKRALRLVEGILQELLAHPTKSMKDCTAAAYATSLKRHHNMVMKGAFGVAVNAAPGREDFISKLAGPKSTPEAAVKSLGKLLPSLSKLLESTEQLLVRSKIER
jgi:hypothetical protein